MGTQSLSRLSQGNSNTQSTGIPIESISTTEDRKLILVDEKKKETLVKYRRDDSHDGPEDTFVVEQNGASKSGLTVEDLRGGDDGEFAVYSQIMGNQAKARPDKFMYSFMSIADNGKAEEDQVTVFTEKTDDGQSRYRIRAELVGSGAVHTSEYMTLEEWKNEEDVYGKEWLDRFEKAIGAQQGKSAQQESTSTKPRPRLSSGSSGGCKSRDEDTVTKFTFTKTGDKLSTDVEYWRTDDGDDDDPKYVVFSTRDGVSTKGPSLSVQQLEYSKNDAEREVHKRIIQDSKEGSSNVSDATSGNTTSSANTSTATATSTAQ